MNRERWMWTIMGVTLLTMLAFAMMRSREQSPEQIDRHRMATKTATVVIEGQRITMAYCAPGVYRILVPGDLGIRVLVITGADTGVLFHERDKKVVGQCDVARTGPRGDWEYLGSSDTP